MSETKQITYPLNRVVATLDVDALEGAISAVASGGIAREDILSITPDDIGHIESPLTEAGLSGFVQRLILSLGYDLDILQYLREQVAEQGRAVIAVPVENEADRPAVAEALRSQGAYSVMYAGRWTIERL